MVKRTLRNCGIIRNMMFLKQNKPRQENDICHGYNNAYYSLDGKHTTCDKCKLNVKNQ